MTHRALLWVWTLGLQIVMIFPARGPFIYADELAYVAAARYFGRYDTQPRMLSAFAHWGYGAALAPLTVFFNEPDRFYRAGTLLNGIAISTAAVAASWMIESLGATRRQAIVGGLIFGLMPPALINSSMLWAESALITTATLAAAAFLYWFQHPGLGGTVLLVIATTVLYSVHPRGLALVLACVAVAVVAAIQRVVSPWVLLGLLVGVFAGLQAVDAVSGVVMDALYVEGSIRPSGGGLVRRIFENPAEYFWGLVGMAWYQIASTAGLFLVGISFWLRSLIDSRGKLADPKAGFAAFGLLAVAFAWGIGATVSTGSELRVDQVFYGRYLDYLAPLAAAFGGAAALTWSGRVWRVFGVSAAFAFAVGVAIEVSRPEGFFAHGQRIQPLNLLVLSPIRITIDSWLPRDAWSPITFGAILAGFTLVIGAVVSWRAGVGLVLIGITSLWISNVMLDEVVHPASVFSRTQSALAFHAEAVTPRGVPNRVFIAWPVEETALVYGYQYWADDSNFTLGNICGISSYDAVVAPVGAVGFPDHEVVVVDERISTQLLVDPSGRSGQSRSVDLAVDSVAVDGDDLRVGVSIHNSDPERELVMPGVWGDVLPSGSVVLGVEAEGEYLQHQPVDLGPGESTIVDVVVGGAVRARSAEDSTEIEAAVNGRGWLGECSPSATIRVSGD